ncbi:MAG: sulfur carrier protein ThiS [Planctomycetota bacterium]
MKIEVNGKTEERADGMTVRVLLEEHGLAASPCAVEVNRSLVSHRQHESHTLRDGDVVEIVTLVGGG